MIRTDFPARLCALAACPASANHPAMTADATTRKIRIVVSPHTGFVLLASARFGLCILDRLPDPIGRRRHPDVLHAIAAQRIDNRADDHGGRRRSAALTAR